MGKENKGYLLRYQKRKNRKNEKKGVTVNKKGDLFLSLPNASSVIFL
jgi:hypothetical protein